MPRTQRLFIVSTIRIEQHHVGESGLWGRGGRTQMRMATDTILGVATCEGARDCASDAKEFSIIGALAILAFVIVVAGYVWWWWWVTHRRR